MSDTQAKRSIFRASAFEHYLKGKEERVPPRLIRPRVLMLLWVGIGILIIVGGFVGRTRVPVFAPGMAVVSTSSRLLVQSEQSDGAYLVVLLPASLREQLKVGNQMLVHVSPNEASVLRRIVAVDTTVRSPSALTQDLGVEVADRPCVLAVATLESPPAGFKHTMKAGTTYPVSVEAGSRTLFSLLTGWLLDR